MDSSQASDLIAKVSALSDKVESLVQVTQTMGAYLAACFQALTAIACILLVYLIVLAVLNRPREG